MLKSELLTALKLIKPGVDDKDKTNLGQDNCLLTEDSVSSFNNELAFTYPIKTGVHAVVRAMDLANTLKGLSKSATDISISVNGDLLSIQTATTKSNFSVILDRDIEERLTVVHKSLTNVQWMDLPENFCEAILMCSTAASKIEDQHTLSCVLTDGTDCLASNNDKVMWIKLSSPVKPMLLKASAIKHIVAIDPVKYSGDKSFFHFKSADNAIVSIRRVTGVFPKEYIGFFDFKGVSFSVDASILNELDVVAVFTDAKSPSVLVEVKPGVCIVGTGTSRGSSKIRAKNNYKGDAFSFNIDPKMLKDMLKYSTTFVVGDNMASITSSDSTFKMITTLIMV